MRKEDIPLLAQHFMLKHSRNNRTDSPTLHPDALKKMSEYSWPGNIRELENVVKRAIILTKGNVINPELLFEGIEKKSTHSPIGHDRLSNYLSESISVNEGDVYKLVVDELERDLIKWALDKTNWNQAQAAKLLGISRVMIHERIEKYELKQ
jgi:DNA-binding NtrC family response regulator